jgi:arylsulfatase A-like enzyme
MQTESIKRPNIVIIILDDVGFSDLGCYGSEIATPRIDDLARQGVRLNNFHVSAMCSPTRASLLTGRNAHSVGVGIIAEWANGMPGYDGRINPSAGTLPEVLRREGYNTLAVGKWHLAATEEYSAAGPFDNWPLRKGFNRWYGFHGALADQYHPELYVDNHPIHFDAPPGYHLTTDLIDRSIEMVRDQRVSAPERPFLLYLALGACHWPHHAPPDYLARQRGRYDAGWDQIRKARLERQIALGIAPSGTRLADRNPGVAAWADVAVDSGLVRLSTRLQEAYAAFLEHTDDQIGRLLDALSQFGLDEDTVVMLMSDNGASPEGGPTGAINLRKHMVYEKDDPRRALQHLEAIGSDRAYNHYSTGWAQVSNTPLRWYKKYTHGGGIRAPLIVRWPGQVPTGGAVRPQFHHVIDIMPTLLGRLGVEVPTEIDGIMQQPLHGMDMTASLQGDDPATRRSLQFFELLGDRALWHDGWKAVCHHEKGVDPEQERWELFHLDEDFSETNDLAAMHPERLAAMQRLWRDEAAANKVLPLDDREWDRAADRIRQHSKSAHVFYPGMSRVDRLAAPDVTGRSFSIRAEIDKQGPLDGVLLAWGSRFGGLSWYIKESRLTLRYVFSQDESWVLAVDDRTPAGSVVLEADFARQPDGSIVATLSGTGLTPTRQAIPRTWPTHGMTAGLTCGEDRGHPVCDDYARPFAFRGGRLRQIAVSLSDGIVLKAPPTADAIRMED